MYLEHLTSAEYVQLHCREKRQHARALALALSHPTWLITKWLSSFGHAETVRLCNANNQSAPEFSMRVNRTRTTVAAVLERLREAGVAARASDLLPDDVIRYVTPIACRTQQGSPRLQSTCMIYHAWLMARW